MELRKIIIIVLLGLAGILIQGTLLRTIFPVGYLPNFLIALLVFLALVEINISGVLLAFTLGLMLDLFSSQFVGPWIGSFILVYALFSFFSSSLYIGSVWIYSGAVTFASLLASAAMLMMVLPYKDVSQSTLLIAVYESLLSGVAAPLVYFVLKCVYPTAQNKGTLFKNVL